jgi:hypothetical protein
MLLERGARDDAARELKLVLRDSPNRLNAVKLSARLKE